MEASLALESTVAMETTAMSIAPQKKVWYKSALPHLWTDYKA
jgi:hypothetical protein